MHIVVVGSGIAGASAAYHAAAAGADVTLVDRPAAGEATAAGAGIVCPWASAVDDPHWYAIAAGGARYYPSLVEQLAGYDLGYRRVGALKLAETEAELAAVRQRVRDRNEPEAGAVSVLDAAQARELFPPLREDAAAVHIPGAARVDGRLVRDALKAAALGHGARLVTGTAELLTSGERVAGVTVDGDKIEADAVVAAAGAWTAELAATAGVTVDVRPQRGQIVHLGLPGVDTARWPVVLPATDHYLLAFDDSRVVAGATRETGSGFDHRVTAGGLAEVLGEALSVAPGLAGATHLETRIGFRPMAPGARPLIGPAADGLYVLTGMGPTGLTIAPYAGRLLADALLGTPDLPLSPYAP